jgi:glycosyltransferase involved in cell wall biosynthesis
MCLPRRARCRGFLVRSNASLQRHHDFKDPDHGPSHMGEARLSISSGETIYANERSARFVPQLSIASPYFRDDPTAWLSALTHDPRACEVEIVLVDDGTGDIALDTKVRAAIDAWPGAATLVRFHTNQGRSSARNRAIQAARGHYILFIDADMLPGDKAFLGRYFDAIKNRTSSIIFGGFTAGNTNVDHDTLLNHSLASQNDCKLASQRAQRGAIAVASNNLLVRRDVFAYIPFDDGFKGWGWEDTEWAMRAVFSGYGLTHIDNPAIHVGLDSTNAMLRKYKEAGVNLRRLIDAHPEAGAMTGAKIATMLKHVPAHSALRPLSAWLARDPLGVVPLRLRGLALKFWRASHAAEALAN